MGRRLLRPSGSLQPFFLFRLFRLLGKQFFQFPLMRFPLVKQPVSLFRLTDTRFQGRPLFGPLLFFLPAGRKFFLFFLKQRFQRLLKLSGSCFLSGKQLFPGRFLPSQRFHVGKFVLDQLPVVLQLAEQPVIFLLQLTLDTAVDAGIEDPGKNLLSLPGRCAQQFQIISLGDHCDLRELVEIHAQNFLYSHFRDTPVYPAM